MVDTIGEVERMKGSERVREGAICCKVVSAIDCTYLDIGEVAHFFTKLRF